MSCLLPCGWCDDLNALVAKYWWGGRGFVRKIHWTKLSSMCKPKLDGGLGFKDLSTFNRALLAKQWWRLLSNTHSLFYRIFKSKYFSTGTFLSAKLGSNPSFVWRSFLSARDLLLDGVCWKIGNGLLVDVWSDKWTERPLIQGREPSGVHCVADLMDAGGWDMEVIDWAFDPHSAEMVKKITLPQGWRCDQVRWVHEKNGEFPVWSAYGLRFVWGLILMGPKHQHSFMTGGFGNNYEGIRFRERRSILCGELATIFFLPGEALTDAI